MVDSFYRAFEDRCRGSREVIKLRLRQYLQFVLPLACKHPGASVFDLGCGRGEWLEIMAEIGLEPYGVDLDEGMLEVCFELGLPAHKGDAIAYLSELPSDSQIVVSAFHVVEHLTFEQLRNLVREALRVLKCGGLLIMETPNPENIAVATRNFYLDPTHQRPIPPQLLSFLPEYYGFAQIKTLRLQESSELVAGKPVSLLAIINGVSPDYAVIAQKGGDEAAIAATKSAFDKEYGLTLEILVDRYEAQAEAKAEQAEAKAEQAEAKAKEYLAQLSAVYASTSWRVTAPMRFTVRSVKWFGSRAWAWLTFKPGSRPRRVAKRVIRRGIIAVKARPGLKRRIIAVAYRLGMYPALSRFYYRNVAQSAPVTEERSAGIALGTITEEVMTPWTRHMGSRLKAARTGMKREEK